MNKKVGQQQGKQNCTNRPNIKKGQQTELGVLLQEPWGQKLLPQVITHPPGRSWNKYEQNRWWLYKAGQQMLDYRIPWKPLPICMYLQDVHIANNGGSYSRMSLVRSLGLGEMGVSLPDGRCSSEVSTDNSNYIQKVKCNLLWVVCSRA